MPGYKRERTASKYEEQNVSEFVASCVSYKTTVSFHGAADAKEVSQCVLLVGTAEQLKDAAIKALPFYDAAVGACVAAASAGSAVGTFSGERRISVGVVPAEASRHNCPTRPDAIVGLVRSAVSELKDGATLDIFVRSTEELCIANAVARAMPMNFSAKGGAAEKSYAGKAPTVRVFFPGPMKAKAGELEIVASSVQLCQRLLDAPTNLLDTTTFTEIAAGYADKLGCKIEIIAGEELRERGYGGVYGVGKAAEFPPALVTLTYTPAAGVMDPQQKISLVGKGIVYDTGGLAIKTPATSMCGMKDDMGGAAAVLAGFIANVQLGSAFEMSCTLCLADNAIGPRAQRNDDIIRMKSGLTVEIKNTDAEGRLVLGDGMYHASTALSFTPTTIIDMATLTGAQGIATGKKHAGLFVNDAAAEEEVLVAGRKCGDTCFQMLYCPEYHKPLFKSNVADMTNLMSATNDAGSACAGFFVGEHIAKTWKGRHVHVDLAFPACDATGATGFGTTLLVQLYGPKSLQ